MALWSGLEGHTPAEKEETQEEKGKEHKATPFSDENRRATKKASQTSKATAELSQGEAIRC